MSEQDVAAAVIAAINLQFTTARAYELTDATVPTLTTDHILVVTSRRYVEERRVSGEVTAPGGRLVTRYVAKTAANLRSLRARTTSALEDKILSGDIGPFVFETDDLADPDEDWLVATDFWTY